MALPVTREQIMNAILAQLRAGCGSAFKLYSRRMMMWEDVVQSYQEGTPLAQPALFLYDGVGFGGGIDTYDPRGRGNPGVTTLLRTVVIYATLPGGGTPQGPDGTTPGGTVLHPLVELVQVALGSNDDPSQGTNTLGGLVSHCWIKGDSLLMTGEIDATQGQGMATVPLEIMMFPSV